MDFWTLGFISRYFCQAEGYGYKVTLFYVIDALFYDYDVPFILFVYVGQGLVDEGGSEDIVRLEVHAV